MDHQVVAVPNADLMTCLHSYQLLLPYVYALVGTLIEGVCLAVQNMGEFEEDSAGIHVSLQTSSLKYGLWINTTKNPRLKTVEFPKLGISIEVTDVSVFPCQSSAV